MAKFQQTDSEQQRVSYEAVHNDKDSDSDESLLPNTHSHDGQEGFARTKKRESLNPRISYHMQWIYPTIISILATALSFTWWSSTSFHAKCVTNLTAPSKLRDEVGLNAYHTVFFNGSFRQKSIFKGTPSPELDAAWDSIIHVKLMRLADNDVLNLGKDPSMVVRVPSQYREEYGDGALVSTEVGHQLHCLRLIRQYTYRSHYEDHIADFLQNTEFTLRGHVDHCIDMIRQFLMCKADTGLVTHEWKKDRPRMLPDFSTQHKCKDFGAIMDWSGKHEIKGMIPPIVPEVGEAVLPWH